MSATVCHLAASVLVLVVRGGRSAIPVFPTAWVPIHRAVGSVIFGWV